MDFFLKKIVSQIQYWDTKTPFFRIIALRQRVSPSVNTRLRFSLTPSCVEVSLWCSCPALHFGKTWWSQRNNTLGSQDRLAPGVELFWRLNMKVFPSHSHNEGKGGHWFLHSKCLVIPCRLSHGQSVILISGTMPVNTAGPRPWKRPSAWALGCQSPFIPHPNRRPSSHSNHTCSFSNRQSWPSFAPSSSPCSPACQRQISKPTKALAFTLSKGAVSPATWQNINEKNAVMEPHTGCRISEVH